MGRAAGLAIGFLLDRAIGDPRRGHPVAAFGRIATALQPRRPGSRSQGVAYAMVCTGVPALLGLAAEHALRNRPVAHTFATAATTWAVLGGTSLVREADEMAAAIEADDLPAARARLPNLCGRDPSRLGREEIVRATVESVAENTSDAAVAPLIWGAALGMPGLLGYRAINTLDAMVGHRNPRYLRFGWASARLDDAANWIPARLTGALIVSCAGLAGGSVRRAGVVMRRDGGNHPSPNAGRCEAALAGALGVRLGGANVYAGRVEERPLLGDGRAPGVLDIRRAVRLSRAVTASAAAAAVLLAWLR